MWSNVIGMRRSWSFRLLLILAGFLRLDHTKRSQQEKEDQSNNQKESFGRLLLISLSFGRHTGARPNGVAEAVGESRLHQVYGEQ